MRDWKFKDSDFGNFPVYKGRDLGIIWSPEKTFINIWAPTAKRIFFRLYKTGQGGEAINEFQLVPVDDGTWIYEIKENLIGLFYTIQVRDGEGWLKDCLLYTSDAADEEDSVDLGGRR